MPKFLINRSRYLSELLLELGWQPASITDSADFSMFYTKEPDKLKNPDIGIALFPDRIVWMIDNKLKMYQIFQENNVAEIALETFSTLPDYLQFLRNSASKPFCFLKTTNSTLGDGTFCFNNLKDLIQKIRSIQDIEATVVIQQGVRHPMLIDGRKFKIRSYVVINSDWDTFVFQDSLVVIHEQPYSEFLQDRAVQLSPNSGDSTRMIQDIPDYVKIQRQILDLTNKSIQSLKITSAEKENQGSYHLFGYDFICDSDGQVHIMEINAYPFLDRSDSVGLAVSKQLMLDFYNLVINPVINNAPAIPGKFIKAN